MQTSLSSCSIYLPSRNERMHTSSHSQNLVEIDEHVREGCLAMRGGQVTAYIQTDTHQVEFDTVKLSQYQKSLQCSHKIGAVWC
jgi:hypothetical protein